jgi:hypothetical protein
MPCLLALLAVAFPRLAIVLLWLFTNFFSHVFNGGLIIPILGFIFLPLTLIVYTYFHNIGAPLGAFQLVCLFVAAIVDLGMVGGGYSRSRG